MKNDISICDLKSLIWGLFLSSEIKMSYSKFNVGCFPISIGIQCFSGYAGLGCFAAYSIKGIDRVYEKGMKAFILSSELIGCFVQSSLFLIV